MTERERAINQDLHVLDEAHRLGRITRAEYRARRRRVLESLYDSSGVITARKALAPSDVVTAPRPRGAHGSEAQTLSSAALTTLLSMRPGFAWKYLVGMVAAAVLLILLAYWVLHGG